jgi:predicted dehydrogenase
MDVSLVSTAMSEPERPPLRVGIVGLGRIYDLHILGHRGNPRSEVVALCDTNPERRAARGAEFPDARQLERLDELLALDLDLVDVLVPTPAHADVVCAALEAGHDVNVQKPMAPTLAEADRMVATARTTGRTLRVMENFVFYEPLVRMKQIVESGAIGAPVGFSMKMVGTGLGGWDVPLDTWRWQMEQVKTGTGILTFDDGWHKFAVARWLFGPVKRVMAWLGTTDLGAGYLMDAPGAVMWEHENGLRGVFDITLAPDMVMRSDYYSNDERFEVTGKKGFVRVNHCTAHGIQQPTLEHYVDGVVTGYHDLDDDWASSFRDSTRHVVDRLWSGNDDELLFGADAAREILAFTLAARESSRRDAPVELAEFAPTG